MNTEHLCPVPMYNLSAYKHNAINVKKFLIIMYLQEIFLSH